MRRTEIALAVLGAGHWGRNLVRNFSALGALRAVCDTDSAVRGRLALPAEIRWEMDPSVLFSDPRIDAVAIATPAATHGALARQASTPASTSSSRSRCVSI